LVAEPSQVNSFLVAGRERAIAIDTGLGIAPFRPVCAELCDLPTTVVNSHYHADHVGGNFEFDEIAIHALGAPAIEREVPAWLLNEYMGYAQRMIAAARAYREIDREFFHLLDIDAEPQPFPDDFSWRDWRITPSRATETLADGDTIDLGGRTLRVLHTPGHSPDSICLLDEKDGILIAGDTLATGPIYAHFPDSDIVAFAASAQRLAGLAPELRCVLVGHFGRAVAEPNLLEELADGLAAVVAGEAPLERSCDLHLNPVLLARFGRCGVTIPLDGS
jgi:glyoxylase-like metal-dependent hydrolase (beta-lactamase superfamily II)